MAEYDFLVLSPAELETLSRDLLQEHLGEYLDNFAAGRDGGIDLRCSRSRQGDSVVQCKRYATYSSLLANLKKEVAKVKKLNPDRYILTTSVPMTSARKKEIQTLFTPYIKNPEDIFGRENLNNLLVKYPKVEEQHYKLWVTSTATMKRIMHAEVFNQTKFVEHEILQTAAIYAENDSFHDALTILQEQHFVIISGLPGIGKTTLAQMLVYSLLGKQKFDEFVFVGSNISDAFKAYDPDPARKQLFFFDDFLGRNFLNQQLERNEDGQLVRFIKQVQHDDSKALIMTTREYILQQAENTYELFKSPEFRQGKYIIDLGKYTKFARARILYNHLFAHHLPAKYTEALIKNGTLRAITEHRHYNPRLISVILQQRPWDNTVPKSFPAKFIDYFDDPDEIWRHIFENDISPTAQAILTVLLTMGTPGYLDDLATATKAYLKQIGERCSQQNFDRAIKELDGTFIATSKVRGEEALLVDYQNPSVQDFLVRYFKSRRNELVPVIASAPFMNQISEIFITPALVKEDVKNGANRLILTPELHEVMHRRLQDEFSVLGWGRFNNPAILDQYYRFKIPPSSLSRIYRLLFVVGFCKDAGLDDFLLQQYLNCLEKELDGQLNLTQMATLIEHYAKQLTKEQIKKSLEVAAREITDMSDLLFFEEFENNYIDIFEEVVSSDSFTTIVEDALTNEGEIRDEAELEDFLMEAQGFASRYGADISSLEMEIEDRINNPESPLEPSEFYRDDLTNWKPSPTVPVLLTEDQQIDNMFDSLRG